MHLHARVHSRKQTRYPLTLSTDSVARSRRSRDRRDFNFRIVCSAFPQKLTEVAQKFYRVIRAIMPSVYPTIVSGSAGPDNPRRRPPSGPASSFHITYITILQ